MERNNMEEEFKEKLNQREIAPSDHAWSRLDAMLNEADDKKVVPVRKLNWLYIAAGFIGFILIATMFFKNGEKSVTNEVVIEDKKENPVNNSGTNPSDSVNEVKQQINMVPTQQQTGVADVQQKPQSVNPKNRIQKVSVPNVIRQETQIVQVVKQNPTTNDQQPTTNKIINQINNPVNANADEQMASIDPQIQNPKTIKVDPNSLLSQVDGELELSFREKVIKLANKKYQNVKVALATRNQE